MNAAPAVSVLMTVHDAGPFLEPAVRSVLTQEWRDLELVLIDNASQDDAVDRLCAGERDPRLRVFREPTNRGIAGGTNRAAAVARGRWIAVMDHDDIALPAKLARQVTWLEAHPEAGGVAARTELIDDTGRKIGGDFTLHEAGEHRTFTAFSQAANFGSHLFRRKVVEAFPRREEFPFNSDFDFVARVAERWPVAALPEVLFRYRVHPGQTTRVHRVEQLAAEGVIRILTALRRSGQAEPIERALAWQKELLATPEPASIQRACARLCLALDLAPLAAYHARRSIGATPGWSALAKGFPLCLRAMRTDRRHAALCARLFFRGPLRTYGLHPWPSR